MPSINIRGCIQLLGSRTVEVKCKDHDGDVTAAAVSPLEVNAVTRIAPLCFDSLRESMNTRKPSPIPSEAHHTFAMVGACWHEEALPNGYVMVIPAPVS
jgi:hypothetical protein